MRLVPSISDGTSPANGLSLLATPFDGVRTIVWDSKTNHVPALTRPSIQVVYAPDMKSATVYISCDVQGAMLRYETNGRYASTNSSSPLYSGPVTVTHSTVFHACWYFNGLKSNTAHVSVHLRS